MRKRCFFFVLKYHDNPNILLGLFYAYKRDDFLESFCESHHAKNLQLDKFMLSKLLLVR